MEYTNSETALGSCFRAVRCVRERSRSLSAKGKHHGKKGRSQKNRPPERHKQRNQDRREQCCPEWNLRRPLHEIWLQKEAINYHNRRKENEHVNETHMVGRGEKAENRRNNHRERAS